MNNSTNNFKPSYPNTPHASFELNQRVTHAQYGAGTIRGFVQRAGATLWLVQFDTAPSIPAPHGAVTIATLFPVATRDLQPA